MIDLKSRIFYVLWERLLDLEAAEEAGFQVGPALEKTRAVLREFPDILIAKPPTAKECNDLRLSLH